MLKAIFGLAVRGCSYNPVNKRSKTVAEIVPDLQPEESVARYLSQLDTADRQWPTEALVSKVTRLREKLARVKEAVGKLAVYEKQMLAAPDQPMQSSRKILNVAFRIHSQVY